MNEANYQEVPAKLELALAKLQAAGHKLTDARRAVLEVLIERGGHLTSAEVLEAVAVHEPSIGRASVFRTLELLTSLAIIRPTYLEAGTPTYVLMTQQGHHSHIICTGCSQVIELEHCPIDGLISQIERQHQVQLSGHLLEFYGLCQACLSLQ